MLVFISIHCSEQPIVDKDTTPPEIYILAPVTGSVVGEVVLILAYAEDNEGIYGVEFLINDTLSYLAEKLDTLYFIEWNSTLFENNKYKLQAIAKDVSENLTETIPIFITVSVPKAGVSSVSTISIHFCKTFKLFKLLDLQISRAFILNFSSNLFFSTLS